MSSFDTTVTLRPATTADARAVADVYLASRRTFVACAPVVHTDEAVRRWVEAQLIPSGGVIVAVHASDARETIVGMMALRRADGVGWIDHLYLAPSHVGHGIGQRLLALAKRTLGAPIRLHTFQANHGARRFYERYGFRVVTFGDGADNEERCPDMLYRWTEGD